MDAPHPHRNDRDQDRPAALHLGRRGFLQGGLAITALAVFGSAPTATAAPRTPGVTSNGQGVVPETPAGPDSSGRLPAEEWQRALTLTDMVEFHTGAAGPQARTDVLVGPSHLHLRVTIAEAETNRPAVVDVLLQPADSAEVFLLQIPVADDGVSWTNDWGTPVTTLTNAVAVTDDPETFTAEAALPFADLGGASGSAGDKWRLNVVGVHSPNTRPSWSWVPIRTGMISDIRTDSRILLSPVLLEGRLGVLHLRAPSAAEGQLIEPRTMSTSFVDRETSRLSCHGMPGEWSIVAASIAAPDGTSTAIEVDQSTTNPAQDLVLHHGPMVEPGRHLVTLTGENPRTGQRSTIRVAFDRESWIQAAADLPWRRPTGTTPAPPSSAAADQLVGLISDRVGFYFCGDPENPGLRPQSIFTFDPAQPGKVMAKGTGKVYPNDDFPEDQVLTVESPAGPVDYPFHEDAEGRRYFFSAHAWYLARQHVLAQVRTLAASDPLGAARIILRFAEAYQTWVPTNDYLWFNHPVGIDSGPPYPSWGGMWARWGKSDLWSFANLMRVWPDISATDAWQQLAEETGRDVVEFIVEQMVLPSLRFIDTFATSHYNYANWTGLGVTGQALGLPDPVHRAVELIEEFASENFLFDGFHLLQTVSYHVQLSNGTSAALDAVAGWSDPEGYVSPRTGLHFEDLDLRATLPVLDRVESIPRLLVLPDGRALPIQDTWASDRPAAAEPNTGSWHLPASGIVRLAQQNDGVDRSTVHLEFHPKYQGHTHLDSLNLDLFGHGQELASDLGYTHTRYKRWGRSQLAHNTVVVDGSDMPIDGPAAHGGSLLELSLDPGGVQLAAARQETAYDQTSVYRRAVVQVPTGATTSFLVDAFWVTGGERHEYTWNGPANTASELTTTLDLSPYGDYLLPEGVTVTPPVDAADPGDAEGHYYGYLYVRDVQTDSPGEGVAEVVIQTSPDSDFPDETAGASVRHHIAHQTGDIFFVGEAQSLRATRISGTSADTNDVADGPDGPAGLPRYTMPKLVLRREQADGQLSSLFTSVIEMVPADAQPRLASVEQLEVAGDDQAVAWRVTTVDDVTHLVVLNPGGGSVTVAGLTLAGFAAHAALEDEAPVQLHLISGTRASIGSAEVTDVGVLTSRLVGVRRTAAGDRLNALVVSPALDEELIGRTALVEHPDGSAHGFIITGQAVEGDATVLDVGTEEIGLVEGSNGDFSLAFFPFHTWTGPHQVRITGSATWSA